MFFKEIVSLWIFLWCSVPSFAQVSEGVPCETPEQQYGLCINIKSCPVLINLLQTQSSNPQIRNFLRSSTCGYIGTTPMVCCPQTKTKNNPSPLEQAGKEDPDTRSVNNSPQLLQPPKCGTSNSSNTRIVNGVPASLGEFPWIVALGYKNQNNPNNPKWLCGGTLITDKHILTAGHCVYNRNDLIVARLGELDLYADDDGATPETIKLSKAKVHEDYSPVTFTNDLAILTLERSPNNPTIWPICLPHYEPYRSNQFLKSKPIVAGWGALYFNGPSSPHLQMTIVPVVTNENCKRAFGNRGAVIDDRILCAGYTTGGKDACQGDSGGPLMYGKQVNGVMTFHLIGVVSYGFRCAEAGYPGVYTRTTAFIDWIQRNIN